MTTDTDRFIESIEPSQLRDASHFRKIIAARKQIADAEQVLREAVQEAREAGDSWAMIGFALDTTGQNAYQRFGRGED